MPWEVGKLLLQVQWVPRDAGELENVPPLEEEEEEYEIEAIMDAKKGIFGSVRDSAHSSEHMY